MHPEKEKGKWLYESTGLWEGQMFCLQINKLLLDEHSDFQVYQNVIKIINILISI